MATTARTVLGSTARWLDGWTLWAMNPPAALVGGAALEARTRSTDADAVARELAR